MEQLDNITKNSVFANRELPMEPQFINDMLNQPEERIVGFIDLLGFSNAMNFKDDCNIKKFWVIITRVFLNCHN